MRQQVRAGMSAPSEQEHVDGRKRQARKVMPMIGPLLDTWDGLPNDVKSLPELKELARCLRRIDNAMETA
jgi:hypothetical protein